MNPCFVCTKFFFFIFSALLFEAQNLYSTCMIFLSLLVSDKNSIAFHFFSYHFPLTIISFSEFQSMVKIFEAMQNYTKLLLRRGPVSA